ncbi:MAG: hypothetical protein FWD42_05930 [Solirubrobacterales bacterium]|nr:hypothetical protein [Solirubrobacterales bacterium]
MTHTPSYVMLSSVGALAAALALGACGGSSSPGANAAAGERAQEQAAEARSANFARCMREHGVSAEVATLPGGGRGLRVRPGRAGSSPEAMEAAQSACARYRPQQKAVNLSPQQKVELEEGVQKFARCMREHGIHVETSTSGGGVSISAHHQAGSGHGSSGLNPESPGFQRAQSACQKLLPKPPGAGRGSGPQLNGGK